MQIPTRSQHMRMTRHLRTVLTAVTMALAVTACRGNEPAPSHATVTCALGTYRAAAQNICISGNCGDAKIDQGEICDDGNRIAGDGCSPDCGSVETCGNGVVDEATGEVCDDGNLAAGDACCGDCRPCPALASPVATEPPQDSLPDTRPCSAPPAEATATPPVPTPAEATAMPPVPAPAEATVTPPVPMQAEAPAMPLIPALTQATATPPVPTSAQATATPQDPGLPVEASAPQDVPISSIEAVDAPTRRAARRARSRRTRSRDRERQDIAELEHTNLLLQRALETERQQHEELQELVNRRRTDELD